MLKLIPPLLTTSPFKLTKRGNTIIKSTGGEDEEFLEFTCKVAGKEYAVPHHRGSIVVISSMIGDKNGVVSEFKSPDRQNVYIQSDESDNTVKIKVRGHDYRRPQRG